MVVQKKAPPPPPKRPPAKGKPKPVTLVTFRGEQQKAVFRAMLFFIRTQGATLRDTWENARMDEDDPDADYIKDHIAFDTIRDHAHQGGWVKQRDDFWREIHGKVLATAKSQLIEDQIAEIQNLHGIRALSLANVNGLYETDPNTGERKCVLPPVKPKSLEGLINAYVRLDKHITSRTDKVMEQTVAGIPKNETPMPKREVPMIADNLTDDEIHAMTRDIVLKRAGMAKPKRNSKGDEPTNDESEPAAEEGASED